MGISIPLLTKVVNLSTAGETRMLRGEVAYPRSHRNSTKGLTYAGASDSS